MTTIIETSLISPTTSKDQEQEVNKQLITIPLAFFDIPWIQFHPIRRLLFYRLPSCSKPLFLNTIVPKLKESLSITLTHYLPVAGNLLYPVNKDDDGQKPVIRYKNGDTISFTIAESTDKDFDELVGNHPRDADQFYDFIPQMPSFGEEPGYIIIPLMAVQVTLVPDHGVCIGFSNHHSLGDANSIVRFIKSWATISRDENYFISEQEEASMPVFDRTLVKDPLGIDTIYWKALKHVPLREPSFPLPTNRVRATFVLRQSDIKKLKDYVVAKKPDLVHVSSFVVCASYTWTCFVKSDREKVDNHDHDHSEKEIFAFAVDARSRVDPPLPGNYFGNCLGGGRGIVDYKDLIGEEGFLIAVEYISNDIKNRVNNKDELFRGAENWLKDWNKLIGKTVLSVSGSPKFDLYEADFGFGKAEKIEVLSIDGEKSSMSLCKSKNGSEGGIEIGFSLPKERMESFCAIFEDGLRKIYASLNC